MQFSLLNSFFWVRLCFTWKIFNKSPIRCSHLSFTFVLLWSLKWDLNSQKDEIGKSFTLQLVFASFRRLPLVFVTVPWTVQRGCTNVQNLACAADGVGGRRGKSKWSTGLSQGGSRKCRKYVNLMVFGTAAKNTQNLLRSLLAFPSSGSALAKIGKLSLLWNNRRVFSVPYLWTLCLDFIIWNLSFHKNYRKSMPKSVSFKTFSGHGYDTRWLLARWGFWSWPTRGHRHQVSKSVGLVRTRVLGLSEPRVFSLARFLVQTRRRVGHLYFSDRAITNTHRNTQHAQTNFLSSNFLEICLNFIFFLSIFR